MARRAGELVVRPAAQRGRHSIPVTVERRLVVEEFARRPSHPSADALFEIVSRGAI